MKDKDDILVKAAIWATKWTFICLGFIFSVGFIYILLTDGYVR